MKKSLSTGFIDPVSLITLGFLIVGLVVTTTIVKNPDISLDIHNWAKEVADVDVRQFIKKPSNPAPAAKKSVSAPRTSVTTKVKEEIETILSNPAPAQPAPVVKEKKQKDDDANTTPVVLPAPAQPNPISNTAMEEFRCGERGGNWINGQCQSPGSTPKPSTNPFANVTGGVSGGTIPKETELKPTPAPKTITPPPAVNPRTGQSLAPVKTPAPTPKPPVATPKPSTNPFANITAGAGGGTIPKETKPKYASKSDCEANTAPNTGAFRACGQYATPEENKTTLANSLNTASFGAFENYTDSFSPDKVKKYWETHYNSREECQSNFSGRAKGYCDQIDYTSEQLSSSVKLGSIITAEGALLASGLGYGAGAVTGGAALTQGLAISTVYQTGQATSSCIDDPSSSRCKEDTAWAAISWANVGTAANLTNAITSGVSQAINTARNVNTAVNVVNIGADIYDASNTCFGENATGLGCALSTGAGLLDVGGGVLDIAKSAPIENYMLSRPPPNYTSVLYGQTKVIDQPRAYGSFASTPDPRLAAVVDEIRTALGNPANYAEGMGMDDITQAIYIRNQSIYGQPLSNPWANNTQLHNEILLAGSNPNLSPYGVTPLGDYFGTTPGCVGNICYENAILGQAVASTYGENTLVGIFYDTTVGSPKSHAAVLFLDNGILSVADPTLNMSGTLETYTQYLQNYAEYGNNIQFVTERIFIPTTR